MALVHNNNLGIYAGVSRQALDLRPADTCEEMLNCFPSIPYGVQRRNPTQLISTSVLAADNQFSHTYDRGLSGESSEQYLITIDGVNGLRVFDIDASEYRTVTYSGAALTYLENSNPEIGFSAITVKDTTFIANKDIVPRRRGETTTAVNYSLLTLNMVGYSKAVVTFYYLTPLNKTITALAPARIRTYKTLRDLYSISSVGAKTTVTINGINIVYTTKVKNDGLNIIPETMGEYRSNLADTIRKALGVAYLVSIGLNGEVYVYKMDGTVITTTSTLTFPTSVPTNPPAITSIGWVGWSFLSEANNGSNPITITGGATTKLTQTASDYDKKAFIWIKQVSVDTTFPYTFYVTIKETNGTVIGSTSTAVTTTTGVASAINTWANGLTGFTSVVDGSIVKITRTSGVAFEIVMSDTYGSQASSAWVGSVTEMGDLPKSFPFKDTIVKVDGIQRADDVAYWVKYDGNQWIEHRDPNALWQVDDTTMPHKLTRNADFTFTLSVVDWADMLVGDENTQSIPEFFGNAIKDLFFINGRMGILTKNGISLSQQGVFENFFRTTILSLLDDSAITTYIDSSRSVGLEYATELQGNIILFGDKLQFALDGNKALSPSTISVQPVSGFEINKNVKPISVGDSVFFLVSKNGYSSLMEMNKSSISLNIKAFDVSAHVPNYISADIMQITASTRDNAIFLRSRSNKDTIYMYNYFGTETERSQMAWSRWVFDMDIKSIFAFDKNLYLFGNRYDATVPLDEFSLAGTWMDTKVWLDETYWVDGEILATPSFEKLDITSYGVGADFRDIGTVTYRSEIELSEWALTSSATKQKELRGNLLIKTIEISSEDDSNFSLVVEDKERGTSRLIPAQYTVNRKPFISGNAKNMRIKLRSTNGDGFQINAISLEGQYNVRSKRV